jgi:hypothetical protein
MMEVSDNFKELLRLMGFITNNYGIESDDVLRDKINEIDRLYFNDESLDYYLITFEKYYEVKRKLFPEKYPLVDPLTGQINLKYNEK